MAIRLVQPHPAARGDGERFIQIPPRLLQRACNAMQFRAREQAVWQVMLRSRLPQAIHRAVQVGGSVTLSLPSPL